MKFRSEPVLLMLMAAAMQLSFASWTALQYNFASEILDFTGAQLGIQQSIREVPGFLAFAAIFLLFVWREQTLALLSLTLLALGVAATGYFPTELGFYITTFIGSIGFHYYETMHQSLTLQWLPKKSTPKIMGYILGVGGCAQLLAYGGIFLLGFFLAPSFRFLFLLAGGLTLGLVFFMAVSFPTFAQKKRQARKLIVRKRYLLYYLLTFLKGARRQIFVVFAAWLMVERFGYGFKDIAALFLLNAAIVMVLSPFIGRLIGIIGEKRALTIEYAALALIFVSYAFVQNPAVAVALYILDHVFFAFAIAIKTYFQKIASAQDIAATAGVAFTIEHIAAIFIPVSFGFLWLVSPASVFLCGAAMALSSLFLARLIPDNPKEGKEWQSPFARIAR